MAMINGIEMSSINNILSDSNKKLDSGVIFNNNIGELKKYLNDIFKEQSMIQIFSKRLKKYSRKLWEIYILKRKSYSDEEIMKLLSMGKAEYYQKCKALTIMIASFKV